MAEHATDAVATATTRRQVIAWSLWDWGSAAFNAVIITFVFAVYLVDGVGADLDGSISAATWLAWSVAAGSIVIAVLAPVTGRRSDAGGGRRRSLGFLTAGVVVVTALMFFVREDASYLWLGLLLLVVGEILFELSQVPYFAMLRQVSTPGNVGRVSALGWAFGYLGGIVLLLICFFGLITGDGGLLGVSTDDGLNIRIVAADNEIIEGSHLLVAAGRSANVDGLDLEKAGVDYTKRGITVNAGLRSVSNSHVYAAGDVAGGLQFTHVAGYHAGLIIRNALFRLPVKNRTVRYGR